MYSLINLKTNQTGQELPKSPPPPPPHNSIHHKHHSYQTNHNAEARDIPVKVREAPMG